jgi:hypothetical protein
MGVVRKVAHGTRKVVGRVSPTVRVMNNRYDRHKEKKEKQKRLRERKGYRDRR